MKIEDLIGRRFYTLSCANDTYKIEGINNFGKVMLSLNGGDKFDYEIPQKCLNAIQSGSWILVEEDSKTPFYLDEYIHNKDADKRVEAQDKCDERPIREVINQICNPPSVEGQELKVSTFKEIEFDFEIQSTMQKIQELLLVKGKEYRRNNNPYHNFEVAARKKGTTPERALDGFLLKHLVSYDDMLNDIEHGVLPKIEVVEEKFNDIIVYFLIQKAQILNRINNGKS